MARDTTIAIALLWLCICAATPARSLFARLDETPYLKIRTTLGQRVTLSLDEYTVGSVLAEANLSTLPVRSESSERTLLQVQALVARTYAVANLNRHATEGFDLCATTHCQLYKDQHAASASRDAVERAVADTRGQIIAFDGKPIQALYHATCGGKTSSAHSVWGGARHDYLQSTRDAFCRRSTHANWQFEVERQDLARALNQDPRTSVGGRIETIKITARDEAGRAREVRLVGERSPVVSGDLFRTVVIARFGPYSLKSTRFQVTRRKAWLVFEGSGFGHGVGLCQQGAAGMASAGWSPKRIIGHFFRSAKIAQRTGPNRPSSRQRFVLDKTPSRNAP